MSKSSSDKVSCATLFRYATIGKLNCNEGHELQSFLRSASLADIAPTSEEDEILLGEFSVLQLRREGCNGRQR